MGLIAKRRQAQRSGDRRPTGQSASGQPASGKAASRKSIKKSFERAEGQLFAVSSALSVIERQVQRCEGEVAYLQNAYDVQPISGRLSFRRGGPQSLPTVAKALAYRIPGVCNYDIASSQTVGLRHLAGRLQELGCDVSTAPLDDYLKERRGMKGKDYVARTKSLPRGLIKRVEHAIKFGAVIPDS